MKYYYLKGLDKNGPYSIEEIKARNLTPETLILREDKSDWLPLSKFEELVAPKEATIIEEIVEEPIIAQNSNDTKSNSKSLKIFFVLVLLTLLGYFAYQKFSLTENDAREVSNRLFNLLMTKDNFKAQNEIYPNFKGDGGGARIVFNSLCIINNISKNDDGDYEVYATYNASKIRSYPIYLIIGRVDGKNVIKASKGISYAYFDKVLEFGKKKGCLTGEEYDAEMESIIVKKNLRIKLEVFANIKLKLILDNIKTRDNIKYEFGFLTGNVTLTNNSDIDFGYFDLQCKVDFYDKNGKVSASKDVLGINGVNAHSSVTGSFYASDINASSYKVTPVINPTDNLKDMAKELVIDATQVGCD